MFYRYAVEFNDTDNEALHEKGIVCAGNYAEAVQRISFYYGESNITELRLTYIEQDIICSEYNSVIEDVDLNKYMD